MHAFRIMEAPSVGRIYRCRPNSLKRFSSRLLHKTDDRFSDLDRALAVREVANTFEQEPVISPGKKPLKALRLLWIIAIVGRALNHESGSRQTLHFTQSPLQ
jgi:hypothetical protein